MSKQDVETLRDVASKLEGTDDSTAELIHRMANQLESDAKRYDDSTKLRDIGKTAFEGIAEMVAALECDYDRLEELRTLKADWESENDDKHDWKYNNEADAKELAELEEAAGECTSREEAEQRIMEDPLSVEVRGDWHSIGDQEGLGEPVEFTILLGTGGPATRIKGELRNSEPYRAWIESQDWFQPWTEYVDGDSETLLTYCRCFYFGEG